MVGSGACLHPCRWEGDWEAIISQKQMPRSREDRTQGGMILVTLIWGTLTECALKKNRKGNTPTNSLTLSLLQHKEDGRLWVCNLESERPFVFRLTKGMSLRHRDGRDQPNSN